jgi:hypothetical protein
MVCDGVRVEYGSSTGPVRVQYGSSTGPVRTYGSVTGPVRVEYGSSTGLVRVQYCDSVHRCVMVCVYTGVRRCV